MLFLLFLPSLPFSKRPKLRQPWLSIMIIAPGSVRFICSHKIRYRMMRGTALYRCLAALPAAERVEGRTLSPFIHDYFTGITASLQASPIRSEATAWQSEVVTSLSVASPYHVCASRWSRNRCSFCHSGCRGTIYSTQLFTKSSF